MYDIIDLVEDGMYCVREIFTDKIIMASDDPKIAKEYVDNLNRGSGFHGWTPEFFIIDNIVV